jgi:large subunit ribosomal protein L18
MKESSTKEARIKRHLRVRRKLSGDGERPRLCVFRSLNHIYAQIIDDVKGHTLAAASTLDAEIKGNSKDKNKTGRAELVGELLARRAKDKKIKQVAFDRGGFKYHGRVKALAEAARKGGLKF